MATAKTKTAPSAAETAPEAVTSAEALPQAGGCYVRQPDGQIQPQTQPQAQPAAAEPETPQE